MPLALAARAKISGVDKAKDSHSWNLWGTVGVQASRLGAEVRV